jgi:uncharacterized protein
MVRFVTASWRIETRVHRRAIKRDRTSWISGGQCARTRRRMALMLELRPNCELCDKDLPPDANEARICSYECTFCVECVSRVLENVCPNCGGGFAPRPIRPQGAWRLATGLGTDPPSAKRRKSKHTREEIAAFVATLRDTPPSLR